MRQEKKDQVLMYVHLISFLCVRVWFLLKPDFCIYDCSTQSSTKLKFSVPPKSQTFHIQILINLSIFLHLNGRFQTNLVPKKQANIHFTMWKSISKYVCIQFCVCDWHVQNSHFYSSFHVKSYLINISLNSERDSFTYLLNKTVNNKIVDINT